MKIAAHSCVVVFCALVTAAAAAPAHAQVSPASGEAVYKTYCSSCHDQAGPRVPPRDALQKMPAARILRTLDFGVMMAVAYPIRREERQAVAAFLGTNEAEAAPPPSAFCTADRAIMSAPPGQNWNGWSATPSNTRFQASEAAG